MKVVIVGGYGVFGSRLAEILLRDGHCVWGAGKYLINVLDLLVEDESMRLPVRRGWFLGLPLPRFLLPKSDSREYVENGSFSFDVALSAPFGGGLLVRYRGHLRPDSLEALQGGGK